MNENNNSILMTSALKELMHADLSIVYFCFFISQTQMIYCETWTGAAAPPVIPYRLWPLNPVYGSQNKQ